MCGGALNDSYDDAEDAKSGAEDFDDKYFDEGVRLICICYSKAGPRDSNTNAKIM